MNRAQPVGPQVRAALLVTSIAAVGLWSIGPASSTDDEEVRCENPIVETVTIADGDRSHTLYRAGMPGADERTYEIEPLAAGTYDAMGASWDAFPSRGDAPPQPDERWYAELLAEDETVLATTEASPDLADGVATATWVGSLGAVTWEGADATMVRFIHTETEDLTPNSVTPVCLGMAAEVQIEQVTTTIAPTTTTTVATTTTSTTVAPSTTTTLREPPVVRPEFTG